MSFINDLAKGFVRSAVNQVGRDGGKVISNQLYGDAHSTPVRYIEQQGSGYIDTTSMKSLTPDEVRESLSETGYNLVFSSITPAAKVIYFFLGIFVSVMLSAMSPIFAFILPGVLTYKGIKKIIGSSKILAISTIMVPKVRHDKRYRNGSRMDGYVSKKVQYILPSSSYEKSTLIKIGISYIVLSAVMLGAIFFFMEKVIVP